MSPSIIKEPTLWVLILWLISILMHGQPDFPASMRSALLIFCALCVAGIGCSLARGKTRNENRG